MALNVVPVASRRDLKTFIDLPRRLYADHETYHPPLTRDRRSFLDPKKSAFFKHGEAQYWLAFDDTRPVGRISAQIDHAAPPGDFDGVGLFGCFDTIDDGAVGAALLAVAEDWLRERGCAVARGPCLLSMNGEAGLLVEGQAEPPMLMVPWHPVYLGAHLEQAGYRKARDLYYYRIDTTKAALEAVSAGIKLKARRGDFTVRRLDRRHPGREMDIIRHVYNDAWQSNWGFVPLQDADLEAFRADLRPFLVPDGGIIVEIDGEAVGVAVVLPNIPDIASDLGADPTPFGWIRLLWRATMLRYDTARIILLGVKARFNKSLLGVAIAMTLVDELVQGAHRHKLESVEAGWVLENNIALIKILERFRADRVRTLRIYDKSLAGA